MNGFFIPALALCLSLLVSGCGGGGSGNSSSGSWSQPTQVNIVSPAAAAPAVAPQGGSVEIKTDYAQTHTFTSADNPRTLVYLSRAGAGPASETILISSLNEFTNRIVAQIPPDTPAGLWDLKLAAYSPGYDASAFASRAVAVVPPFSGSFDFVVLADYHVGDGNVADMADMPSADLRAAVLNAIKARSYEFALLPGDLNSGSWLYRTTYQQAHDELEALDGRPLFIVPGNHDSYLYTTSTTRDDGFVFWANIFGPSRYSFDMGNFHFTGFNTYEWDDADRSGFTPESRGIIRQAQFDWIMSDIASARERGKKSVLFAHHCPPDSWDPPPCADCGFVTGADFHAAIRDAGVKYFICGHLHTNKATTKEGVKYFYVSTAGGTTDGTLGWGYNMFHASADGTLTRNYVEVVHKPQ